MTDANRESGGLAGRCVGKHDVDLLANPPVLPPLAEVGYLDLRCYSRLHRMIAELPAVAIWLQANLAAGQSGQSDKVTGTADDPIPLRLDILDLIGPFANHTTGSWIDQLGDPSIQAELNSWSVLLHDEHGAAWPDDHTITGYTRYLLSALTWIAAQPWVDEFIDAIGKLTSRAGRAAPWKAETRRLKDEACTSCGMAALVTHVADGVTRCEKGLGGCGAQSFVSDYMRQARGREAS